MDSPMKDPWHLIADIGGTNARFSALSGSQLGAPVTYDTRQGESLLSMARRFSDGYRSPPKKVVVAAAGPVIDNTVQLTNASQSLSGSDLRGECPIFCV